MGATGYIGGRLAPRLIAAGHDVRCLTRRPERLAGVTLASCLVPSVNSFDYAALHAAVRLTTFLLPPPLRPSFEAGRVQVIPLTYSGVARHLASLRPDLAILHVAPPRDGVCSFGTCADFGPLVAPEAKRRMAVINHSLPRPRHSSGIAFDCFDAVVEIDEPVVPGAEPEPNAELMTLARQVAEIVPDGATLQTGLGAAPAAVWRALLDHRGLRLWSGMVTDGFLRALEAGAMAEVEHLAGFAFGSASLFERLHDSALVRFAEASVTHGAPVQTVERFFAINSAIEVDLLGQANLEWVGGRLVSGVGGAPDFNRAAQASAGGRAIIALPATARGGTVSRIVTRLEVPAVSIPRAEADLIVTEYGAADLRGLALDARAEALIGIAAPHHRDGLAEGWRTLRRGF